MDPQPEASITVKEAAKRIGYSVRQTDRFIKKRELEAVHVNASLRHVLVASVDAFNVRHGRRPVDPLERVKDTLHQQEHVVGDILRQVALLRAEMEERYSTLSKRIGDLVEHLRLLKARLHQEREARLTYEQTVSALSTTTMGTEGNQDISELVHQLLTRIPRFSSRGPLPQEKRGYPPATIRLVHFAAQRGIEPSTLRQHAEKTPGLATIYERPNATTKRHEWWLLPEQQAPLLRYWQAQHKAWTPCPDCPHDREAGPTDMPDEREEGVKTGEGGAIVS